MARSSQDDLIHVYQLWSVGDKQRPLLDVVKQFQDGRIIAAPFQRDFVWKKEKIVGWANTIIDKNAVGVIVTYQLSSGSPVYLLDGFQRLTATSKVIENPPSYGFNFGSQEAERFADSFDITIQHRIYENHPMAVRSFQALNSGTPLLTGEYYKGELILFEKGKLLYESIPAIMAKYETKFVRRIKNSNIDNKLLRDSFSLFYQFITKAKQKSFWDAASSRLYGVQIIERILANYVDGISTDELKSNLNDFERFIKNHYGDIEEVLGMSKLNGKSFSYSVNRWLVHFHIWASNNNFKYSKYNKMITNIFNSLSEYGFSTGSVEYEISGQKYQYAFKLARLDGFEKLAASYGVTEFSQGKVKKIKKFFAAPGYDEHHPEPFSIYGNGETVAISSIRNRSLGNKIPQEIA